MRSLFKVLCLGAALLLSAVPASAVNTSNPYQMANDVAQQTLNELKNNRDRLNEPGFCERIISKNLMPYVDVRYASYKVIGVALKQTSPQERGEFTQAFEEYLRQSLTDVLRKYTDQEIIPATVQDVPAGEAVISVKLGIAQPGKDNINVILKTRCNSKTGEWKAFDMVAENVSILDAKTAEISPIIAKDGIQAAIKALREHKSAK